MDLYLDTDLRTMTEVWLGRIPLRRALRDGAIELLGDRTLERSIASWLQLNKVSEIAKNIELRPDK